MGGEHWADQRPIEEISQGLGFDAHLPRALKGVGERAGAGSGAGDRMGAVAAGVMLILGDIGEVREIAVGAHGYERLVGVEAVERGFELAPRGDLIVAMEADRGATNLLDQFEDLLAFLLAHRVAKDSAEQADVVAEGQILGVLKRLVRRVMDRGFEGHRAYPSAGASGRCCTAEVLRARAKIPARANYLASHQGRGGLRALCPRGVSVAAGPAPVCGRGLRSEGPRAKAVASRAPSAALSLSSHSKTTSACQPMAA